MTRTLKKLLSALLALVMVLSMIPAVASAKTVEVTDEFSYEENAAGWVEIDSAAEFNDWFRDTAKDSILRAATKAGKTVTAKLILKSDLALNVPGYVGTEEYPGAHNITVDLNGHSITAQNDGSRRAFAVYGGTLTVINGKDTGGITMKGINTTAGGILYVNKGTLNMYNVKVTRTQDVAKTTFGGGIVCTNKGTLNFYDCVLDATGAASVGWGGVGYFTNDSVVNLYNTRLLGGSAVIQTAPNTEIKATDDMGGCLYTIASVVNMYGGEISGGYSEYHGGNIYIGSSSTFNLFDGVIKDGTNPDTAAGPRGGNIYVATGTFNQYGGEIINGRSYNGKSIYVNSSTAAHINFYGGTLRHDTVTSCSGTTGFITKGSSATMSVHNYTIIAPLMKGSLTAGYFASDCTEISAKDAEGKITITPVNVTAGTPVAATCSTPGYTPYTCGICNQTANGSIVVLAHTEQSIAASAATCTKTGLTEGKKCAVCDADLGGQLANGKAQGHKEAILGGTSAGCTTDGLTAGKYCTRCNEVTKEQEVIPATGHNYNSVHTEGTADSYGYTTFTCTMCGDSYVIVDTEASPTYVATADGVPYASLQEALNAGGEIVLLENIQAVDKLVASKDANIWLNEKTLTLPAVEDNYGLVINAKVTINGNGTIRCPGTYGIGVSSTGDLTLGVFTKNVESIIEAQNTGEAVLPSISLEAGDRNDYIIGNWGKLTVGFSNFDGVYCCVNNFAGTTEIGGAYFQTEDTDWTGEFESADVMGDAGITIYFGGFPGKLPDPSFVADNSVSLGTLYYPLTTGGVIVPFDYYIDYILPEKDSYIYGYIYVIMSDITMTEKLVVDKEVNLNLNGHTLTLADIPGDYGMVVNGALAIEGEGTIVVPGTYGISVADGGTFVSLGGHYIAGEKNNSIISNFGQTGIAEGSFEGTYCCINNIQGLTLIEGGKFTTAEDYTGEHEAADVLSSGTTEISGGIFSKPVDPENCAPEYGPKDNGDGTYSVVMKPKFTKNPSSVTVDVGKSVIFTVAVQGEVVSLRWEYSRNGINWYNTYMDGYDTDALTVPVTMARNGYQYRCVATDAYGNGATSAVGTLTVKEPAVLATITVQPEAKTAVAGTEAIFTVEAIGEGLTYQWQYTKNGTNWYYTGMTGATTAQLTVAATVARNGYQYRCVITDDYGTTVTTEAAALTVTEKEITTSGPEDQVAADGIAVFTVNVEGEGLTYRWQYQRADGTKWFDTTMEGYNTNTLTVTATTARNGYKYRCIITDAYGNETISEEAVLTVE